MESRKDLSLDGLSERCRNKSKVAVYLGAV